MEILQQLCTWWPLAWILPFVLGLALGWAIWARYKQLKEELEKEVKDLNFRIHDGEESLAKCRSHNADLDGQIAMLKGRIREAVYEKEQLEDELKTASSKTKVVPIVAGSTKSAMKEEKKKEENKSKTKKETKTKKKTAKTAATGIKSTAIVAGGVTGAKKRGRPKKVKTEVPAPKPPAKRGRPKGSTKVKTATAITTKAVASKSTKKKASIYDKIKSSNLQIIEGIGPKMEEVLKNNSIKTWRGLASKTPAQIKAILDKSKGSFGVIDPKEWPRQAKLAMNGSWTRLVNLQKELDGGKGTKGETDAKVEKLLVKMGIIKTFRKNDLKAIEGVGPKIEGLLKKAGINTWEKLSKAKMATLRGVLAEAGPRFKLANPSTWAKQASLADKGKWDELAILQEEL